MTGDEALLERLLADDLTQAEAALLHEQLSKDPQRLAAWRDQFRMAACLHAHLGGRPPNELLAVLRGHQRATSVQRRRRLVARASHPKRRSMTGVWVGLAAVLGVVVLFWSRSGTTPASIIIARMDDGAALHVGDERNMLTASGLSFFDGSRLEVEAGTTIRLESGQDAEGRGGAKRIHLLAGAMTCTVAAQPAGAPFSVLLPGFTATVRGTRFRVARDAGDRITVEEGRVDVSWKDGTRSLDAGAWFDLGPQGVTGGTHPQSWPRGSGFPLGLYQVENGSELAALAGQGWNLVATHWNPDYREQRVGIPEWRPPPPGEFAARSAAAGIGAVVLVADPSIDLRSAIDSPGTCWWMLPSYYTGQAEVHRATISAISARLRREDPLRRPILAYLEPEGDGVQPPLLEHVDLLGITVYPVADRMPLVQVRERIRDARAAIRSRGAAEGGDPRQGQQAVIAILELYYETGGVMPTATSTRHGIWASIVGGARGLLIWSYSHRQDHPWLEACWTEYRDAARILADPAGPGPAIAAGMRDESVHVVQTSGPTSIPRTHAINSPTCAAVAWEAWSRSGRTWLVLVNSAESPVTVRISGRAGGARPRLGEPPQDGIVTLPAHGVTVLEWNDSSMPGR